jgi:hypothetical protein
VGNKKIILGFVGERGAGKDEANNHCKTTHGATIHKFSTPMSACLDRLGLPKTTENLILWSELSREGHTPGKALAGLTAPPSIEGVDACLEVLCLAKTRGYRDQLQSLIMNAPGTPGFGQNLYCKVVAANCLKDPTVVSIASGIRRWSDVEDLRALPQFKLIYVTASPETRYDRVRDRGEKAEERDLPWEQFLASQSLSTEVDIPSIGAAADYTIVNEDPLPVLTLREALRNARASGFEKDHPLVYADMKEDLARLCASNLKQSLHVPVDDIIAALLAA